MLLNSRGPILLKIDIRDDVLLVAVDPSSEGHEQHLEEVEIGLHKADPIGPHPGTDMG